jgi:hypothetical protein
MTGPQLRGVRVLFEPRNIWIGVYWTERFWVNGPGLDIYICLLPCFPLLLRWAR